MRGSPSRDPSEPSSIGMTLYAEDEKRAERGQPPAHLVTLSSSCYRTARSPESDLERRTMPVEKWSDTVVVVHLGNDPQFSEDLESLEERMGQGKVDALLDLSGVGYINSSNIARLLKIRKMMVASDSRLVLCGVNNRIWSTL